MLGPSVTMVSVAVTLLSHGSFSPSLDRPRLPEAPKRPDHVDAAGSRADSGVRAVVPSVDSFGDRVRDGDAWDSEVLDVPSDSFPKTVLSTDLVAFHFLFLALSKLI